MIYPASLFVAQGPLFGGARRVWLTCALLLSFLAANSAQGGQLTVRLETEELVVCEGQPVTLVSSVSGGIPSTYEYAWTGRNSNTGELFVPSLVAATDFALTVTDATGRSGSARITLTPRASTRITTPDQTICGSLDPFDLEVDKDERGRWFARGMERPFDRFDPSYLAANAKEGDDQVIYLAPSGCRDTITISITPLDIGFDDAACPDTPPFKVSGGLPEGGQWTSEDGVITPDGMFDPAVGVGSYDVDYTGPNGCLGTKTVNIGLIEQIADETVCESADRIDLVGKPAGGRWSGQGITNSGRGYFDPGVAGPGVHTLSYTVRGCVISEATYTVGEIEAGPDFTSCPSQAPFNLTEARPATGGTWRGSGIADPTAGLYDPAVGKYGDTLFYETAGGCTDFRIAYNLATFARPRQDTTINCIGDPSITLSDFRQLPKFPQDGVWSGVGLSVTEDTVRFVPELAGRGVHTLTYTANECSADVIVRVGTSPGWAGDTVCVDASSRLLASTPPAEFWVGDGITDFGSGEFDARLAGLGTHTIKAATYEGCERDRDIVVVEPEPIDFLPPGDSVCFSTAGLDLGIDARRVTISSGAGDQLAPKPVTANFGVGSQTITLEKDEYGCPLSETIDFVVREPLGVTAAAVDPFYCYQAEVDLEVSASGGVADDYRVSWSDDRRVEDLTRTKTLYNPTTVTARLGDGCSDPVSVKFDLNVGPPIRADIEAGPEVCFGQVNYAMISPADSIDFTATWSIPGEAPFVGDEYVGLAGDYAVTLTEEDSGCEVDTTVTLPYFAELVPNFTVEPATALDVGGSDCISIYDTSLTLINNSAGARRGVWRLSDGTGVEFFPDRDAKLRLTEAGTYWVTLDIGNGQNCVARNSVQICATDPEQMYFPNAFTPNGDGKNDAYQIAGLGVDDIEWMIFDRWGAVVYRSDTFDSGWDGNDQGSGRASPPGVYTLQASYESAGGGSRVRSATLTLIR